MSTDSLKSEKERIWKLWKDANISRLGTLPSTNTNGTEFIWDIPQGQRMKIKTFTKGSKPASGYPFLLIFMGVAVIATYQGHGNRLQIQENGVQHKLWGRHTR